MKLFRHLPLLLPLLLIAGCSSTSETTVFEDRKYEYKKERAVGRDLEVPPDLTRSTIGTALELPSAVHGNLDRMPGNGGVTSNGRSRVLPKIRDIEMKREGDRRWLLVQAPPEEVWPVMVSFWQEHGILLLEQDPTLGVLSTDWIENRAEIPSDFITDAVRGVMDGLYSSPTRDQFRVRLEPGSAPDTTELYITHRGVEESFVTGTAGTPEQSVWRPRPTDHDAEATMLRRMMVFFGVSEQRAERNASKETQTRSKIVSGKDYLLLAINEELRRGWKQVGVALDRVGMLVEDRKRSELYYLVRYSDPVKAQQNKGMLSRLAFWSDDKGEERLYRVQLAGRHNETYVSIANEKGITLLDDTARQILTKIQKHVK